uniref:Uncharacterized protein n=1 Tax=Manihot esculenta TaxID=3983 RepID=A0A2C9U6M9_MANES
MLLGFSSAYFFTITLAHVSISIWFPRKLRKAMEIPF